MSVLYSAPTDNQRHTIDARIPAEVIDVHSLHKSATMFLYRFFQKLSAEHSLAFISENDPNRDPDQNPYSNQLPEEVTLEGKRLCRAPIRSFDLEATRLEGVHQKRIFHLRDPRDILVSEYYSFGWIHPHEQARLTERRKEIQAMSIDDYVIRQAAESTWPVDAKYKPLEDYSFDVSKELVVKYEQMVKRFYPWCRQIVDFIGVKYPTWVATRLAWKYRSEFKSRGESMTHKRNIAPGDHRNKLQAKTIQILNDRFEKILTRFGYEI